MPQFKGIVDREHFSAGLLKIFLYYRFVLSLALLLTFYTHIPSDLFGVYAPDIYLSANIIFVVIAAITLGFYQLQKGHLNKTQLMLTLLADIFLLTILMFCSGGLDSGIGYLLLVTVAAGAIFFTGQLAVFIPAIASLCIIAESVLSTVVFERNTLAVFPAGVLGVLLFITSLIFSRLSKALIQAQEAIKSESQISASLQELNQLIIDRMRTGIVVVGDNAEIHQINDAARELLGRKDRATELQIGSNLATETNLLHRLGVWRDRPAATPQPFTPDQGNNDLQANFATLDAPGLNRTIVFLEDFRAHNQQAQQLKLASLGRLTGSIAHEIRNPLGAISHASELLNELKENDATASRLTEIINTHVKRVNHIVESVLQLSRKQDHHPEKLQLSLWLHEFLHQYRQGSRDNPVIDLHLNSEHVNTITFDPIHLQRILTNLLDNAIRYSLDTENQAWASIEVDFLAGSETVVLDVVDKGPGIAPKYRNQLFEPFFSTSQGGSGLGLYIARELCAINFASIKYEPSENRIGCFRIAFSHPDKILKLSEEAHEHQ